MRNLGVRDRAAHWLVVAMSDPSTRADARALGGRLVPGVVPGRLGARVRATRTIPNPGWKEASDEQAAGAPAAKESVDFDGITCNEGRALGVYADARTAYALHVSQSLEVRIPKLHLWKAKLVQNLAPELCGYVWGANYLA